MTSLEHAKACFREMQDAEHSLADSPSHITLIQKQMDAYAGEENIRLNARITSLKKSNDVLGTSLATLQEQNRELLKDKERLDWLEKLCLASSYYTELRGLGLPQSNGVVIVTGCGSGPFEKRTVGPSGPNPLRQALDKAALAKEGSEIPANRTVYEANNGED
jgi:hypothetical protein